MVRKPLHPAAHSPFLGPRPYLVPLIGFYASLKEACHAALETLAIRKQASYFTEVKTLSGVNQEGDWPHAQTHAS